VSAPERIVDARGLLCPWPVVRLMRAARETDGPVRIRLLADDPAAAAEVALLCSEQSWECVPDPSDGDVFNVVIAARVNRLFTSSG
jgi:tRNA 2-thiouridine synthesizing protein A